MSYSAREQDRQRIEEAGHISELTPTCEHCGRQRLMMVPMEPGRDGKPWYLCPKCFEDGVKPMREKVVTVRAAGESVVPSTGARHQWTETRTDYVPAKDETANFDRMSDGGAKPRPKRRSSR